jgi:hypothetical protein
VTTGRWHCFHLNIDFTSPISWRSWHLQSWGPPLENHLPKSFLGAHSLWYHQRQVVNTCQHQWYRKSQYSRRQNPLWTPKTSGITHRHPNVVPIQKIPPAVFFPHVQTA